MFELDYTTQFRKDLKKAHKQGLSKERINKVLDQLAQNGQVEKVHRPHILSGNWDGFWECRIAADWLLIYLPEEKVKVVRLIRTGTHSELFKK